MSWKRTTVRVVGGATLLVLALGLGLVAGAPTTASAQEDTSVSELLTDTTSTTLDDTTSTSVDDSVGSLDTEDSTDSGVVEDPTMGRSEKDRHARGDHDCGDATGADGEEESTIESS